MAFADFAHITPGERNVLVDLRNQFELLVGYRVAVDDSELLKMANQGDVTSLRDMGGWMQTEHPTLQRDIPWASYGLDKNQYAGLSTTYGTEFKKITGQDITPDAMNTAFTTQKDVTGGFLSGSQYAQQLTQDKAIQDTYGWVKYGLDYQQFQQHKQSMQQAFGGMPSDSQGVQQLSYWHQNQGANMAVTAQPASQAKNAPVTPGTGQSEIR